MISLFDVPMGVYWAYIQRR